MGPPYQGWCVLFPDKEAPLCTSLLLATTSVRLAGLQGSPGHPTNHHKERKPQQNDREANTRKLPP